MPNIVPLFAVPVLEDDFFVGSADKEFCSKLNMKHDESSNFDITTESRILNLPQLNHIKLSAQKAMDVYTRDILHISQRARLEITTSWYATVTNHSKIPSHFHGHSLFTGIIILDTSPGSKLFLLTESPPIVPKMFEFDYEEFNIFNSKTWWLDLEPNKIYIFPSTINHSAELSEENTSMTLIAFDTFISGSIGEDLNGINITLS